MNFDHFLKVTGIDLVQLAKHAYDMSRPQGMGFLHFKQGSLTDEQAAEITARSAGWGGTSALELDYVGGRAVKIIVYKHGDDLYMPRSWYYHTQVQYKTLLSLCNVATDQIDLVK